MARSKEGWTGPLPAVFVEAIKYSGQYRVSELRSTQI